MMLTGLGVTTVGVVDALNGPEARPTYGGEPSPQDESKPSDFVGPGITAMGTGAAIIVTAAGSNGASDRGRTRGPRRRVRREQPVRER